MIGRAIHGAARALRRFARAEQGTLTVEFVLIVPILFWGVFAVYTFVDAFRSQTLNLKASYAISDLLSRQEKTVGADMIAGLGRMHQFMVRGRTDTALRVSVLYWSQEDEDHHLVWSCTTSDRMTAIRQDTLPEILGSVPRLADGESVIVVDTLSPWVPPLNFGLGARVFDARVIASPRFVPQLKWDGEPVDRC